MYSVLVILAAISAVLLILVVLIQESKGGGLASSFASSNQIMGVRKTTDIIEKATWTLTGLIVLLCIATSYVTPVAVDASSIVTDMKTSAPAPMNLPGQNNAAPATSATPAAPAQ